MITIDFNDLLTLIAIVCFYMMYRENRKRRHELSQLRAELTNLISRITLGLDQGEIIITAYPRKVTHE